MSMKLLGISTSPRPGGNTDLLLDAFLRGGGDAGAEAEKITLQGLKLLPCTQCDACREKGWCILQDDIGAIYEKILLADVTALASPIYFMAHCAQAKILIDRCQVFWARTFIQKEILTPGRTRQGVFISAGATQGEKVFAGAKLTMKYFFNSLQMVYAGEILVNGVDVKGAVLKQPAIMNDAYKLGQKIVNQAAD
ncbi:MAG: flavodoxin family protein [Sedimentisphaerales bacterium]|nr:flavodoxin family protein [Sedimentisphaerales bacterium]